MARLGVPYNILYVAKNEESGISGIVAKVLAPDLSVFATITLSEVGIAGFEGSYTGVISTDENTGQEGDYLILFTEPNGHKQMHRVSIMKEVSVNVSTDDIGINRMSVYEAYFNKDKEVLTAVESNIFEAILTSKRTEAYFYKDELEYFLDNQQVIGELE